MPCFNIQLYIFKTLPIHTVIVLILNWSFTVADLGALLGSWSEEFSWSTNILIAVRVIGECLRLLNYFLTLVHLLRGVYVATFGWACSLTMALLQLWLIHSPSLHVFDALFSMQLAFLISTLTPKNLIANGCRPRSRLRYGCLLLWRLPLALTSLVTIFDVHGIVLALAEVKVLERLLTWHFAFLLLLQLLDLTLVLLDLRLNALQITLANASTSHILRGGWTLGICSSLAPWLR